jgi:hypothetical protein
MMSASEPHTVFDVAPTITRTVERDGRAASMGGAIQMRHTEKARLPV